MKRLYIPSLLLVALAFQPAQALTLEQVLSSSDEHHPVIAAAAREIEAQRGSVQEAQGAFDWRLDGSTGKRLGNYDGAYGDAQVTRRLADSNVRVYSGYRASDREFPTYEDRVNTSTGGEFNAGVVLALLRDRIIDEDRFAYTDATLALRQKESDALLARMRTQHDAMIAYFDWLALGRSLTVTQSLVDLAEDRQKGFAIRAKAGDVARIFLTENLQYILRRKAELNEDQRKFDNACVNLSLYWRDENGKPKLPTKADLPKNFPELPALETSGMLGEIERVRTLRPEALVIDVGMERERNKLRLGENAILPKLDLAMEGAQNYGADQNSRNGSEGKVMLTISIPLQQNIGEGRAARSRALLAQLERQKQFLNERIATEIQSVANNVSASRTYMDLSNREIVAAEKMEAADKQRFEDGAVDFFVINMREENTASAKQKYIDSSLAMWRAIANYYFATLKTDQLLPKGV